MSQRVARVLAASVTLQHVPDLVRYGSKPSRDGDRFVSLAPPPRSYAEAIRYPPNQVVIGNCRPEDLWNLPRPWWNGGAPEASMSGPFGEILDQRAFYALLAEVDQFGLVRLGERPAAHDGELALHDGSEIVGAVRRDHELDESLTALVLLENLAAKAGGVHAARNLFSTSHIDPGSVSFAIGCGEEAIGDRYQRGGGNLAKSIAEAVGLQDAGGMDVKSFCAAPVHALIVAGALVEAGVHERILVVAGGSLAKLGMKWQAAADAGIPILEDVLAGIAIVVGSSGDGPRMRLDAVGRHRVRSGSSQQAMLEDLVGAPLSAVGRSVIGIDRYATELHNPEITEPAQGGDVPDRNYRMIAALGVMRGEVSSTGINAFVRDHGLPGFSPTQGHIASAVPWMPHALNRFLEGDLRSTLLMAKGSLFLGRMTRQWDGASLILEA